MLSPQVAGYCLTLDMTARDFQEEAKKKGNPWTLAKGFDTALPVSRFISMEELADPNAVRLWCKVRDQITVCYSYTESLLYSKLQYIVEVLIVD